MKKISIIVPCYNEEKNIILFYNECVKTFKNFKYNIEIIFINDGSKDKTFKKIEHVIKNAKSFQVKGIDFSRNFGKDAAMYAGMKYSTGDYVAIIDADLQQKPELIKDMVSVLENEEEYDEVCYYQEDRIENKFIAFLKNKFYSFISKVSDIEFVNGASDFRLFRRYVIDSILKLDERNRFSKGIFSWVGYNIKYLPYVPEERQNGVSSFNFIRLIKYALSGIISFSSFPIKFILFSGFIMSFISIVYILFFSFRLILKMSAFKYWLIYGLLFLSLGLVLSALGMIGQYVYYIHLESKSRPIYVDKKIIEGGKVYEK